MIRSSIPLVLIAGLACASGCRSPYAQDRLAAGGAVLGGVTGAIIGSRTGHAAGGALIGAALGTVAGAVTGSAIDEAEARNCAVIQARLGRPAPRGAVSIDEVIAMVQAGVPEEIVVSYVRNHGISHATCSIDLIRMQREGVPPAVMAATQSAGTSVTAIEPAPPTRTIIVERHGCYHHVPYHYDHGHHGHRRPRLGWSYHSW